MGGNGGSYSAARAVLDGFGIASRTENSKLITQALKDVQALYNGKGGIRFKDGRLKMSRSATDILEDTAEKLSRDMYVDDKQMARDYKEIMSMIRGRSYYLSQSERSNIADFGAYQRREGILQVTSDRSHREVDSLYHELSSMYPNYFPQNHTGEQVQVINDALRSMRNHRTPLPRSYQQAAKRDLVSALANAYYRTRIQGKKSKW